MAVGSCAPVGSDDCYADGDVLGCGLVRCGALRYGDGGVDGDPLRVSTKSMKVAGRQAHAGWASASWPGPSHRCFKIGVVETGRSNSTSLSVVRLALLLVDPQGHRLCQTARQELVVLHQFAALPFVGTPVGGHRDAVSVS